MFSKCLWKMFCCDGATRGQRSPVEFDDVLDSLVDAIEALPSKRDSRSDPILEPHFKLVSIVHKLVQRGILKVRCLVVRIYNQFFVSNYEQAEDARERLLATPYARNVNLNNDGWKPYILEVLRNLRSADKSNWHHRIVLRVSHLSSLLTSTFFADGDQAAHVLYDDSKDDSSAMAAKSEISQQIFTKTMTLQVWRPENERAGRHFVYTTRYVYFFVGLLNQLNDRANLDMLIRRVRRKPNDYVHHSKLWEDICLTYVKVGYSVQIVFNLE